MNYLDQNCFESVTLTSQDGSVKNNPCVIDPFMLSTPARYSHNPDDGSGYHLWNVSLSTTLYGATSHG